MNIKGRVIKFDEIKKAACALRCGIEMTPCVKSRLWSRTGMDIYLKEEFFLYTGCFKERGARYALMMLSDEKKKKGVVSASLGNHAQGISYHGNLLGVPVHVVMPKIAPIMKIQRCKELKANIHLVGTNMAEAKSYAVEFAEKKGLTFVNGYDDPHVIAGQGTVGLEILEQVPDVDAVVIPVGGGGLLAGVAVAMKNANPNIKVIAVESEKCASFAKALEVGHPEAIEVRPTIADGLAVPLVGYNSFETAKDLVDKMVVVKEETIAIALLRLIELQKCIVEGAGATPLAAILSGKLDELKGKRIVLILSGGNIDTTMLGRCVTRGLVAEGRLLKIYVNLRDSPGAIGELFHLIESMGAKIKNIKQDNIWAVLDVFTINITIICEMRDFKHASELKNALKCSYPCSYMVNFPEEDINEIA